MRRHFAIFAILVIAFDGDGADSFSPLAITTHRNSRRKARATALPMAGAGMGMGGMTAKSKKKGKKKGKKLDESIEERQPAKPKGKSAKDKKKEVAAWASKFVSPVFATE